MSEKKTKPAWAWIKKAEVYEWALTYLGGWSRKNPGQPPANVLYDKLCMMGTVKEDKPVDPDLLRKMKAAWASRKFRNKKGQLKLYSFALRTEFARQFEELAKGGTKIGTLERIISECAEQEIAHKSAKRDEAVYKQRAKVFEDHLDKVLAELHTYKLTLKEAGIDTSRKPGHQDEVVRLTRERKKQILTELTALPSKTVKAKKNGSTRSARVAENAMHSASIPSLVNDTTPKRLESPHDASRTPSSQRLNGPQENDRTANSETPPDGITPAPLQRETIKPAEAIVTSIETEPTALATTPDTQTPNLQTATPTAAIKASPTEDPKAVKPTESRSEPEFTKIVADASITSQQAHEDQAANPAIHADTEHVQASPVDEHERPTGYEMYSEPLPFSLKKPSQQAGPTSIAFLAHYIPCAARYEDITNQQIAPQQEPNLDTSTTTPITESPLTCSEAPKETALTPDTSEAFCESNDGLDKQLPEESVAVSMPSDSAPKNANSERSLAEIRAALLRDNPPRERQKRK